MLRLEVVAFDSLVEQLSKWSHQQHVNSLGRLREK